MPSLQIRKLPEDLYLALKQAAARKHRSISQQAIVSLNRGLRPRIDNKERRKKVLESIEENSARWASISDEQIVQWIREDRDH